MKKKMMITLLPVIVVACSPSKPEKPVDAETVKPDSITTLETHHQTPSVLGHWNNEGLLRRIILQDDGLCFLEDFIIDEEWKNENENVRRCYGTWAQLEVQIQLAIFCEPDFKTKLVPTRFTYNAQKDELMDEEGNIFVHNPTVHEPLILSPPKDIVDFFVRLPGHYLTYSSSSKNYYFNGHKNFLSVIDRRNGYIADEFRQFEAALFRQSNGEGVLVISNRQDIESNVTRYVTHVLQYDIRANSWVDIASKALPELPIELFFEDRQILQLLENKAAGGVRYTYHFEPPRQGTDLRVRIEIDPRIEDQELADRIRNTSSKVVTLKWNRTEGRFLK